MKVTIIGRKCTPKESFKEHVDTKLKKIDKLFGGEGTAKVTASVAKNKATVELTVDNRGMFFRSQATSDDMSDAFDTCVDNMIRQIRKNKTKVAKRIKSGTIEDFMATEPIAEEPEVEEEEFDVVRHKTMTVKPQSLEEAILQMNMLGHNFYMFENMETGEINVVYARKNGGYGVLEPAAE